MNKFQELGLIDALLRAVNEQGYKEPTPIQALAVPAILSGCDVQATAQTGTGKTAGFTLPVLQRLAPYANNSMSPAKHPVRALILAPTRELAIQVEESVKNYARYLPLRSVAIYGGVSMQDQIKVMQTGVELVIATPGRLMDHVSQKTINLSQVEIFILDEADRMLDMGFIPDIRKIIELLPAKRQNLMFSATFSDSIHQLAKGLLHNPQQIQATTRNATAESVLESFYSVPFRQKKELLSELFWQKKVSQAIVFTNTKLEAAKLAQGLIKEGIKCDALHGDRSQRERIDILERFKAGEIELLVATDVAARGLDIENLPLVFNYDLPSVPEDYVHRIGRTGRAGSVGQAISFVSDHDRKTFHAIETLTHTRYELLTSESILNRDMPDLPSHYDPPKTMNKIPAPNAPSLKKTSNEIPALLKAPKSN